MVNLVSWVRLPAAMDLWLPSYLRRFRRRRARRSGEPPHLLLCVADHYEPKRAKAAPAVADARVQRWVENYPRLFGNFRDSDGRPPRHTFFFPEEEYELTHLDSLTGLCRSGFGEVEIHLHHDRDTAAGLRAKLEGFKRTLVERHGQLARNRATGDVAYGFIHGNWALDNSHPDGRWCGVDNELDVLRETGCYADFTMPSAPNRAQTRIANSIYYAAGVPGRSKSHDSGVEVGRGPVPDRGLMLVQGPLLLNWKSRKRGLLPRVENGCLQGNQPPTPERLDLWLKARIGVPSRPDWTFVKLHTHGAWEPNEPVLLGEPMARLHRELARRAAEDPQFHFHYVTAREMYNLARAAEAGWQGSVEAVRDFELVWNGALPATAPRDHRFPSVRPNAIAACDLRRG